MLKWEYLRVRTDLTRVLIENNHPLLGDSIKPEVDDYLKEKGEDGWELVSIAPIENFKLLWVFKRLKTS
jgi:hypothetical protein